MNEDNIFTINKSIKTGSIIMPKIVNGSKINIGKHRAIVVMTDHHFNWFQKKMIKWCFGFNVEDFTEE